MEKRMDNRFLLNILTGNIALLLAVAMLFGASSYCVTKLAITPKYRSTASFYIEANEKAEGSAISSTDVAAATKLVETCRIIVTCDTMMKSILANVDVDYTESQLMNMISVSAVGTTQCFNVSVTCPDTDDAYNIAQYITDYAPMLYIETVKYGALNIYNEPIRETVPVSPSAKRNVAIGCVAGFVLAYLAVFLRDFLDTRLADDDDLFELYNVPMFAELPDFNTTHTKGYGYGHYGYGYGGYDTSES